jgi:U3 small nucleolar RNA-associated protein 13
MIKIDPSNKFIAIVGTDNSILIYDAEKYSHLLTFTGHSSFIYDIQFNPDKEKFLLYSASEDNTIRVWDIILGKNTAVLEGHESSVRHLALTNDGKSLISVSMENTIILWKLANNSIIKKYDFNLPIESIFYFTRVNASGGSKDIIPYLLIGCENGYIVEFNLKTGSMEYRYITFIAQPIIQLQFLPKNNRLYSLTAEQTILYIDVDLINENIEKSTLAKQYPGYCQEILDIKLIDSNSFLFSSNDNVLKLYDINSNSIKFFEGHSDFIMNISIKGQFITTTSKDNSIILWINNSENNLRPLAIFKGHSESVNYSSLLLKNKYQIISTSKDNTIKIWDFSHLVENFDNEDSEVEQIKESLHSIVAHDEEISIVKPSPNEKMLASGSYDKMIKLWDSKLNLIQTIKGHKRAITDLSFSKYAKVLASASTDKTIKLWNLSDYTCINTFEGHLSSVLRIHWLYFGTHIISAGADGLVKFWNIKTSECINTINSHEGKIWALDVLESEEDNPLFITGGTDSKITIWNDITADKENTSLVEMEDKILKQERLRALNGNKEYYEAMQLSLELNRKFDFISSVKNFINSKLYSQETEHLDHISMIINNRKSLEEDNLINNEIGSEKLFKQSLLDVIKDAAFRKIIKGNLEKVLEIIRDNNITSSNYFYVQILLKIVLITTKYEDLLENKKTLGTKNKGFKSIKDKRAEIKDIDFVENFEIVKAYSEKHLERINRELTKSYLLDYILEKMKIK